MNRIFNLIACCACLLAAGAACANPGQASPKEDRCAAEHAGARKLLDSIQNLSLSKQIISVDEFVNREEVRRDCYADDLLPFEDKDIDLVSIDAAGVEVKAEYSFRCDGLKVGHRCGGPDYEERPLGEDHVFTAAIPKMAKTLRVMSKWDGAKLVGIFDFKGRRIKDANGEFARPPDGTRVVAIYRIQAPLRYRKYEWIIHSDEMKPSSVDVRGNTYSLKDMPDQ